jgi:uncharacterized protein YgiM (DUF1202 family)
MNQISWFYRSFTVVIIVSLLSMMPISAKSCEEDEQIYGTVNTKSSVLNIRASPSENAQVVDKAEKDATLQILDDSKKWYKVRLVNGKVGYARSDYLKVMKRVPLIEGAYGVVTATQLLNIREGPGAKYQETVRAPENTEMQILCDLGDWYKVQDENGVIGYASSKYIMLRQSRRPLSEPAISACSVTSEERLDKLLEEVTNIYEKPGCRNTVRQRLNAILNNEEEP